MHTIRVGHLELESPWGNGGGVVKTAEEVERMAHTGVGWIEAGSYTLEPRQPNSSNWNELYSFDSITGETINSLGMPNKGMDATEKEILTMNKIADSLGKKLVINVAPVTNEPIEESRELLRRAYDAGAEAVLLNAGCPNVISDEGRHEPLSHNAQAFGHVILALSKTIEKYNYPPMFVRISPMPRYELMREVLRPIRSEAIGAVFTPNSWPIENEEIVDTKCQTSTLQQVGGKSGPAMASEAQKQTGWAQSAIRMGGRNIDVVSSAGITSGKELMLRIKYLGAAAGCGTTLYYESAEEGWSEVTDRLLRQFAEAY